MEEYQEFEKAQQEAVERLSKANDMSIDKAAEGLDLSGASIHDLILGSFLYGGVRSAEAEKNKEAMSPVASPNFEGAKRLLELAFSKESTMAAVQIGSLYVQEDKLAGGKNMKNGEDCKQVAFSWYKKAADLGNPVSTQRKWKDICLLIRILDGLSQVGFLLRTWLWLYPKHPGCY